ncbi:peptidylprolyl isomerase [bacterium]|nr:peptidylprolyl isomerase [bacterium]
MNLLRSSLPCLLLILLGACSGHAKDEGEQADSRDNGLAYRVVTELPVVDGQNMLVEKYDFGPEARRISDSVPSSTDAAGEQEQHLVPPPRNRHVMMNTSKGQVQLLLHGDWSPNGARRFIELVETDFYDGAPWFRVTEDLAQTGLSADPELNAAQGGINVPPDPMQGSNTRGMVAFAQGAQGQRNTQWFVNLKDNPLFDTRGFVPFAEVVQGMDVLESLYVTGDPRAGLVEQIGEEGVRAFRAQYPEGDVIESMEMMD